MTWVDVGSLRDKSACAPDARGDQAHESMLRRKAMATGDLAVRKASALLRTQPDVRLLRLPGVVDDPLPNALSPRREIRRQHNNKSCLLVWGLVLDDNRPCQHGATRRNSPLPSLLGTALPRIPLVLLTAAFFVVESSVLFELVFVRLRQKWPSALGDALPRCVRFRTHRGVLRGRLTCPPPARRDPHATNDTKQDAALINAPSTGSPLAVLPEEDEELAAASTPGASSPSPGGGGLDAPSATPPTQMAPSRSTCRGHYACMPTSTECADKHN